MENTHGFDDREFYASAKGFKNYAELERNMRGWNERWNGSRHTKKLGWSTPNEVLEIAFVRALCFWLSWCEDFEVRKSEAKALFYKMDGPQGEAEREVKESAASVDS